jgi:hypothetical protein
MADFKEVIDAEDSLSRITQYELARIGGRVFIYVHEIIAGKSKGKFVAYPTWIVGWTKEQYTVMAESHDEALTECLSRIKGVPFEELRDAEAEESEE